MSGSERYCRQIPIPAIGENGQRRLQASSALVIGCGGLGSAALYCLASAGVGTIGFLDPDTVSLSNLNRQSLYSTDDIGRSKAEAALMRLVRYNPELCYRPRAERLTTENAETLIRGYDVVVLAVDTLAARLAANSACVALGIPLINGGVNGFSGAVSVVTPKEGACLACLYGGMAEPDTPSDAFAPVVSVIGALESQLALLLLLGQPNPLKNRLLSFHGGAMRFEEHPIFRDPACAICGVHAR